MLFVLRILFGFALFMIFGKAVEVAGPMPQTEGTTDAGYLALAVLVGIANAVVWAPLFGRLLAEPLVGAFTSGHPGDHRNRVLQLAHKLALRRSRRMAVFFAFLEGVRHPDMPGAFVLGMQHSKPGSRLQSIFAREVWRFSNAEQCLRAWKILKSRGVEPGLHERPEVNLLLLSQQRDVPLPPEVLAVPPAPPAPPPRRHEGILLFDGAEVRGRPDANSRSLQPRIRGARRSPRAAPEGTEGPILPATTPEATINPTPPANTDAVSPAVPRRLRFRERVEVLFTGRIRESH